MHSHAIVVYAFNRPEHLAQTLQHLQEALGVNQIPLYFFIDGPRNDKDKSKIAEVQKLIEGFSHPLKKVHASVENFGLRNSVIGGLNRVFEEAETAMVLEDDICIHPEFINFHKLCLKNYSNQRNVFSISAYVIPQVGKECEYIAKEELFLAQRASSWGWSTWANRWKMAVWDNKVIASKYLKQPLAYHRSGGDKIRMLHNELLGKSHSWAIIWDFNHFMNQAYGLYPNRSLVKNVGLDDSGTHSKPYAPYQVDLNSFQIIRVYPFKIEVNTRVQKVFREINRKVYRYPLDLLNYIRVWLKYRN